MKDNTTLSLGNFGNYGNPNISMGNNPNIPTDNSDSFYKRHADLFNYLGNLGAGLLSQSGPSTTPTSFGQSLGKSMMSANDAQAQYENSKYQRALMGEQLKEYQKKFAAPLEVKAGESLIDPNNYKLLYQNPTSTFGSTPAALQLANAYEEAKKDGNTEKANNIALFSKIYDKGMVNDGSGGVAPIPGAVNATSAFSEAKQTGKNRSDLTYKGDIKGSEEEAKNEVERKAGAAKAQNALKSFEMQANLVNNNIDKALSKISGWSTGYGSYLSGLPNSDARELKNILDTIKGNIGFDKLQQMRENSPTGGALGQVSDFENRLLQAVNGALDPGQANQLKENLMTIKSLYPQVLADRQNAFNQDYGKFTPNNQRISSPQQVGETTRLLPNQNTNRPPLSSIFSK